MQAHRSTCNSCFDQNGALLSNRLIFLVLQCGQACVPLQQVCKYCVSSAHALCVEEAASKLAEAVLYR